MAANETQRQPASVVGTGALGTVVARAFLTAGHPTTVWNRTTRKADALVATGARRAGTVTEAVTASTLVVTCLPTYDDVRSVLEPVGEGLSGRTLVNLTSGTPEQAREMASWAAKHGARYLDGAAMSGTRLVGQADALFVYGGPRDAFEPCERTLTSLGRAISVGPDPGIASFYDMALFGMNMGLLAGFYQALALVRTAGVSATDFASVATGYLSFVAGLMPDHARQVEDGRYPGDDGTLDVLAAAMGHLVHTSREQGVDTGLPGLVEALIKRGITAGHGGDGVARLAEVIGAPLPVGTTGSIR